MKSFKQMIKSGEVKRADAMKVRIEDIYEEPGFNLRREGEDLETSINDLAEYIAEGGQLPPLEVRPREEGGVWLVDGHRRRRAYLQLLEEGFPVRDAEGELWLSVVAFTGNDADRVARVITSQEGRKLSPLELAEGYKRLAAFGWSADQIGKKVGKTRQHVDQMLLLSNANTDVQQLVAAGYIAAATAVEMVRAHGENAGVVISAGLKQAQAAGKTKVTAKTLKPRPRDKVVTFDLIAHLRRQYDFSLRTFGPGQRTTGVLDHIRKELAEVEANPGDIYEWADVLLLALDGAMRAGFDPELVAQAIGQKQKWNEGRKWPDWRTADPDKAIEHVPDEEAA